MQTTDSVRSVKGVGEKAEQNLHKLKIETVGELLEHYPRNYDEIKPVCPIEALEEGDIAAVEGVLMARPQIMKRGSKSILTITLRDTTGSLLITWFNMPFLRNQLKMGTRYLFRGKVEKRNGRLQMVQPKRYTRQEFYKIVGKMQPIYPLTAGITNHAMAKLMQEAITGVEDFKEFLPAELRKRQQLIEYKKAMRQIHFPANQKELKEARKRLAFDELFLYTMALNYIRENGKEISTHRIQKTKEASEFLENLPFSLTGAQKKVYEEICADMEGGFVMNRLVQGDVGSGKTIVAVLALLEVVKNGYQGAFMVPTEVLAAQHYQNLTKLLADYGVTVGLLSGSLTAKEKRQAKEKIASGEWNIVIGTHALIQDGVAFDDLGLVITDEQHRFGVKQREKLYQKGKEPHVLAMSATPIPRSLGIILYRDLDVSIMNEMPASRLPIKNSVVGTSYRPAAWEFIRKQVALGHQAYVICPLVEASEETQGENVIDYSKTLMEELPSGIQVGVLHGKMKSSKKNEIMQEFAENKIQVLVSTTVVEVGVNVPNATVMLIENADRFGLAQLHQLRGRVGRGDAQSYCIMINASSAKTAKKRLEILNKSNDGFFIASEDLKLRGPGDFFGIRQSGDLVFALADIYQDAAVLQEASEEVKTILEEDPELTEPGHHILQKKMMQFQEEQLSKMNL